MEYGSVNSFHKFNFKGKEYIFVIVHRGRPFMYENDNSLYDPESWTELIGFPLSWITSVVGMFYKDGRVFPVENTSIERRSVYP